MKTSISLFLSDILPHRRKIYHKIVKNKIFKNQTTEDVFKHLKRIGLDGFELLLPQYIDTTDADIIEVKRLIRKSKFPVFSVHQSIKLMTTTKLEEIARLCEIAQMVNAQIVVLHINSAKKQVFDEKYVAALHKLEDNYNIKVTFENMERHIQSYFHAHRWHADKFTDLIEKMNFHITFDIVHLAHSGGDIITFFENNKKRILNVHLSDYKKHILNTTLRPLRYKHMPLGDGELPIENFITMLKQRKYPGFLTLELHSDINGVEKSISLVNQFVSTPKNS
ncbi:MAG TPA: sugar phosphate isomerase/epimerase family protein [Candidatus Saccharimonadales bacterium]|nr:sugar phosphate isomerase/epimerase family protein [Candidatus Saccharimonadales bacterium]